MSDWRPATETEAMLREALAANDQDYYFRILARTELLLPVSADAVARRAPMGWATWTTGDRTHVLAFTSPLALHRCLNEPGGSYRVVHFYALAADWPNNEWWLAVNPGMPIESYLPAWFLAQLTRGEVHLPGRTMGARARMGPSHLTAARHGGGQPVRPAPQRAVDPVPAPPTWDRPDAAFSPHDRTSAGQPPYRGETVDAEIVDYPAPGQTGVGLGALLAATSDHTRYAAPSYALTQPAAPEAGDNPPSGYPSSGYPSPGHSPSGHASSGLPSPGYQQASSDATPTMLARRVPASGISTVSGSVSPAGGVSSAGGVSLAGGVSVGDGPVSGGSRSGPAGEMAAAPADPPAARVAPPIRASRSGGSREALDAEVVVDPWAGFVPANETESHLRIAKEDGNTDAFLSTLLLARVVVPVPVGTASSVRPQDRDFPWQIEEIDGQDFIVIYTSAERLAEHRLAGHAMVHSSVSVRFVQVISAWPSPEVSFVVNPGSPVGATLPGSQIVALATWADEVGLRDDPPADVVMTTKKDEAPARGVAGAPAAGADRATVMQRTVPHAQVPFYLERGYDRVSGFVNRASEIAHLTSPKRLYRALGLAHASSPFSEDDLEVYIVRWVAHRADLYRLPYGGQHEAAMRAMQGWVIERSPFRGNGFAPGDTEVVSEFKVDSIRLPHGAQMWRLTADGMETLVATFDADVAKWVTAPALYRPGGGYA